MNSPENNLRSKMTAVEIKSEVTTRVETGTSFRGEVVMDTSSFNIVTSERFSDISPVFILECLSDRTSGDGLLFAALHRGRFIFKASENKWLIRSGSTWLPDIKDEALAAVDDVAKIYLLEAKKINNLVNLVETIQDEVILSQSYRIRKKYIARAWKLRSETGRKLCLRKARDKMRLTI